MKKLIPTIIIGLLLSSCAQVKHLEYTPFTYDIDGKNELSISTYPAWYAKETFSIPFLYKKRVTHEKLYFQVFIRDINKKSGKNPNVESIRIHSFSYRIGNNPSTELISDYDANFWMQDQPKYNPNAKDTLPVLYVEGWTVSVAINFTLNGKDYSIKGEMPSAEQTTSYSLFRDFFR